MMLLRWLVVLLCLCSVAMAADKLSPSPNPGALATDWWLYFQPDKTKPEELTARINAARDSLNALGQSLGDKDKQKSIASVISLLERYEKLTAAELPALTSPSVPKPAYTLEQLLDVHGELEKVEQESLIAIQDVDTLESAVKSGERDLSRRKVAYLELDKDSPEKLQKGLEIMRNRVQLEVARQELRLQRSQSQQLVEKIKSLQTELRVAMERLNATPEEIERLQGTENEAQKQVTELTEQLTKLQLGSVGTLASSPAEKARAQLARQQVLALEVQISRQQVIAANAELGRIVLQRMLASNETPPKADRERLETHTEMFKSNRDQILTWRQTSNNNRSSAVAQVVETPSGELSELLQKQLTAADRIDELLRKLEDDFDQGNFLSDLLDSLLSKREGRLGQGVRLAQDAVGSTWATTKTALTTSLFEISETPVTTLGLLRVLLILTIAWWISKLLRKGLQHVAERRQTVNQSSVYTLGRILHYFILAIGIIVGLSSIGLDFTKFALFASALGVGIGFGLQTLVGNFIAGLIILFEKSIKVGDFLELESGVTGEVKEINMRSTLITSNDNIDIVVPNSEFVSARVTNWTMREVYRRIHVPFGVAYGTDKELVREAVLEAANEVPWTLKSNKRRAPQVWFVEFGDSSLNFELVVWLVPDAVKRPNAILADYLWEIDNKLKQYNIEIPFPQRDLHLRSAFGRKDEAALELLNPTE